MNQCENFDINPDILWTIFDAYCEANLPNDAIRVFNRMCDFRVEQNLDCVEHLLYLLCRKKFESNGQDFFDDVKAKFDVGIKCFTILIRGWGDIGYSSRARKVLDEMIARGCIVDVPTYNVLMEALLNGGKLENAYGMYREILSKGLSLDAFTFSIFIRFYCKRDNVYSVFMVLDRMKRYKFVLKVFTYNCIIKRLCASDKVEEAYYLLDTMFEAGALPDTWSYNAIQAFHCDRNEVNRALMLVSRMETENCKPDNHTYNMLLKILIMIGRFDIVEAVWETMLGAGFFPSISTYAVLIRGFLKRSKAVEACKYFESMIDEGITPYTSTLEVLRNKSVGWGMMDKVDILPYKMSASSSSPIKELYATMRGQRSQPSKSEVDGLDDSDEDWPFRYNKS